MAAAAHVLEPIEQLMAEAPRPSGEVLHLASAAGTPKVLAARIVRSADRDSRAFVQKLQTSVAGLKAHAFSEDLWSALANLISANIAKLEADIQRNEREAREALAQDPPPIPLAALRTITRGLHQVYTAQHRALVDLYYQAQAEVWDRDPEASSVVGSTSSADDVAAFFNQVRGG